MPEVTVDGVRLHYVEAGSGPETVVFSHSFLVDHHHFEAQVDGLSDRYRVLAYDHRDHGESQRMSAPYGMEDIYRDGLGFLEAVADPPCHWIGLSTGGFVGLRLAIRRPDLLQSLTVIDSAADAEPLRSRIKYRLMLAVVRFLGYQPVIGQAMKAMFGPRFLRDPQRRGIREIWKRRLEANDPEATVRFGRAIFAREGLEDELGRIRVPTLVAMGEHDRAVSLERGRRTAAAIPGARFEIVPTAGHLSTIERPLLVTRILRSFLDSLSGAGPKSGQGPGGTRH